MQTVYFSLQHFGFIAHNVMIFISHRSLEMCGTICITNAMYRSEIYNGCFLGQLISKCVLDFLVFKQINLGANLILTRCGTAMSEPKTIGRHQSSR